MAELPGTGRGTRQRQTEAFWNRVTFVVGCGAVVGIVASIVLVITKQVVKKPVLDEDYLTRDLPGKVVRNKKNPVSTELSPSLMDGLSAKTANLKPGENESSGASTPVTATALTPAQLPSTPAVPPTTPGLSIVDAVKAVPLIAGIDRIEDKREAISRTLDAFFSARTLEDKLTFVRDSQRVKPLMQNYYSREPMHNARFRGLGLTQRVDEPGYRFGLVQALFEDSSPAGLIIEETDDGRYLVDWECLVRYGELSWVDFQRMRPVEPKLLRVLASKAEGSPSVTALAPASSLWLELRHPAESGTVLGYFDRNDPKYAPLVEQMQQGNWKDVPVTLRLCFPNAPTRLDGSGVRIAGVEGKGWLIIADAKPKS